MTDDVLRQRVLEQEHLRKTLAEAGTTIANEMLRLHSETMTVGFIADGYELTLVATLTYPNQPPTDVEARREPAKKTRSHHQ